MLASYSAVLFNSADSHASPDQCWLPFHVHAYVSRPVSGAPWSQRHIDSEHRWGRTATDY